MNGLWRKEWATGLPLVDAAHYEIVELIAGVMDDPGRQAMPARARLVFDRIEAHVLQHFLDEEAEMLTWEYPRMLAHRVEHGRLSALLAELRGRVERGELGHELLAGENRLLGGWLLNHLATADRDFAEFLRARR